MPSFKLAFQNSRPPEDRGLQDMSHLIGKTEATENKYQQLLRWHGIPTEISGGEFIGDCLFHDCPSFIEQKPGKFSCNRQTCQWQCFVCGRSGNAIEFIREIHRNNFEQTTKQHRLQLIELRKGAIDLEELEQMEVSFNPVTREWALPSWNTEGKIMNLYIWRTEFDPSDQRERRRLYASPSHGQLLYGLNNFRPSAHRPIFVMEGHWDYLAWMGLLRRTKQRETFDCLGIPGSFPRKDLGKLNGRKVLFVLDNDEHGRRETNKIVEAIMREHIMPLEVKHIEWPQGMVKNCKDASDIITSLPPGFWSKGKK